MSFQEPARIIVEPVRGCNLECTFCKVRFTGKQMMSLETAETIARQMPDFKTKPDIVVSGRGEPTLNPNLPAILEKFHNVPNTRLILETNGIKKVDMVELSLLTTLVKVNTYFPEKVEDRKKKWWDVPGLSIEEGYPKDMQGLTIPDPPLREQCHLPSTELVVHYNGDVSLCRFDWKGEAILGNIFKTNMSSIWQHNERLYWSRRFLANRIRCPFPWCAKCDVRGKRISDPTYDKLFQDDIETMRRAWNLGGNDGRSNKMGESTGHRLRRTQSAEMPKVS